ncbi:hypothetical protein, partial [Vibrio vulnificus]|uniref:hypothetical protein n=1 Tax=Vibrio vulnificus TaxID=672 RepID=UPI001E33E0D3
MKPLQIDDEPRFLSGVLFLEATVGRDRDFFFVISCAEVSIHYTGIQKQVSALFLPYLSPFF